MWKPSSLRDGRLSQGVYGLARVAFVGAPVPRTGWIVKNRHSIKEAAPLPEDYLLAAVQVLAQRGETALAASVEAVAQLAIRERCLAKAHPYLSRDCPAGYQTVLGWFTAQGLESEDLGTRADLWAWRQSCPKATKVKAPSILRGAEVAEWVYAYPDDWLEANRAALLARPNGRTFPTISR